MSEERITSTAAAASAIKALEARVEKLEATRNDKFDKLDQLLELGSIWGQYKGTDGKCMPAIITGAFPKAGTVDIVVFDNRYSGGKCDLTGICVGTARNEIDPYIKVVAEPEVEDNALEEKPEESNARELAPN